MGNIFGAEEFYPTPESLLDKITKGIDWRKVQNVLEPSAGKGNIADYIKKAEAKCQYGRNYIQIDCIEINKDLQHVLKGKEYPVIHDDFLTFKSAWNYDLIIMNPPFKNGDDHLLKALEVQKNGGAIICILNAETIRNPYSNKRKRLVQMLEELNADIQYYEEEFSSAEITTDVEIAVIKVDVPKRESDSILLGELKKRTYAEVEHNPTELVLNDYIKQSIQQYEFEVECGIQLMKEYKKLVPYLMDELGTEESQKMNYSSPILELKLNGKSSLSVNGYVKQVRMKYWKALFANDRFMKKMTSAQRDAFSARVNELSAYDFSFYNIKTLQIEMSKLHVKGIEDCILNLFDTFTRVHTWYPECEKNIHYYTGWATNKCYMVNLKKVILPFMKAYDNIFNEYRPDSYELMSKIRDIETALNYLDSENTPYINLQSALSKARETGQTKRISLRYFYVTFYKKGTCHIEWKNEETVKKLNIFAGKMKNWLPPSYGKKRYSDMSKAEQKVVLDFDGSKENYADILARADEFIYDPKTLFCIEEKPEAESIEKEKDIIDAEEKDEQILEVIESESVEYEENADTDDVSWMHIPDIQMDLSMFLSYS